MIAVAAPSAGSAASDVAESSVVQLSAKKVSFAEALKTALERSEDVQSKQSELRASRALLTQAQLRFLPDLAVTGSQMEAGSDLQSRAVTRTLGVQSNLNLFRFGADSSNLQAAESASEAASWDLRSSTLSFEEKVATKILDVVARQQETEIRRKLSAAQAQYARVADQRFGKGILPRQELDKVTIDSRIAEARLRDAELAADQALENLRVDVGDVRIAAEWPWIESFQKKALKPSRFQSQDHPQWKYLKSRAAAADSLARARQSEIWPSLDLALAYQKQQVPATSDAWQPQWAGTLTLTIPLFSRWENRTAAKVAREVQVRADLATQRAERELEAQWKVAERDFRGQLESAIEREQTLRISRRLYEDNFRRFQAGRSSANDLFNDQDRLYQTELLAIQGWYSVHVSYVKLCHSLGSLVAECRL